MTILETFIKLRDDLKTWVTNNLNQKANISYVDEKFAAVPEFDPTEIQKAINANTAAIDTKVDKEDGKGLSTEDFTTAEKDKLRDIEANANFYEHPIHSSHRSGLYKVTVDESGHVSGATLVEKEDIVALGIPAQDTTYEEEIEGLSGRLDDVENDIDVIINETLNDLSGEFENYKETNNKAVSTNTSGIEANKTAIEEIQNDYLKSTDKTQLRDDISKVSEKATANASAIKILNGEGAGSVKQSIDNAFNEFAANVTNDDVVNTYKELIDYAAKHGPEFTELVGVVYNINNDVTGIETDISNYKIAVLDQLSEVNTSINTIQGTLENKANAEHGHEIDEINALQEFLDELQTAIESNTEDISTKADLEHAHSDLYYDKDEIEELVTVDDIDDICGSNVIVDGGNSSVVSYATKQWVQDGYQPKGNYLTSVPDGYATESYVDTKISAIQTPDVSDQINVHNLATDAHNDIRLLVDGLTARLNTLADCDDTTLDQMSEVVEYIKSNQSLIEGITTKKVNVADIVDNLTTNVSYKPLSAAQGVVLNGLIEELTSNLSNYQPKGDYLTAVPAGYATEEFVKNQIADAELNGEEVDLSGYAQKSEIPTKISQLTNDSGYLTEHQSLEGLATQEYVNEALAEKQPVGDYALKSEIPTDYITTIPSEYITESELNSKGYLTEHQDLSGYALKTEIPSVDGLASESYVKEKVAALVNSAPETLNTLDELAAALGDDANFATTMANELGKKANTADLGALATKDSLTAADVGALPSSTIIPDSLSDLTADSAHRLVTDSEKEAWNAKADIEDIPNVLPNPNALTFTGAVSATYDGSSAVTINIPTVSGDEAESYDDTEVRGLISTKMDKNNPVGTGSFSMNRKSGTEVGNYSHAEGYHTTASAGYSHAEGYETTASASHSHAEGFRTVVSGAWGAHAEGYNTIAAGMCSHVQGKFNIEDTAGNYAHIVGNGTSDERSNAHTVDWDGNAWFSGNIKVGGTGQDDSNAKRLLTEDDLTDGSGINVSGATPGQTIKVKAVDENGKPTEWEAADFPVSGGNADTATKATQDASGNVITTTYETKENVTTKLTEVNNQITQLSEEKVTKSGLTLGVHTDGLVYIFVDGLPHGNGLDIKADVVGDVFGYVDENNIIILNGTLANGTYTIKYEMDNGRIVEIGDLELDNSSEAAKGNLADPTSADWLTDKRLAMAYGYTKDSVGNIFTNYIPVTPGDVIRVKGLNLYGVQNGVSSAIACYSSKTDTSTDSDGALNAYTGGVYTAVTTELEMNGVRDQVIQDGNIFTYTILVYNDGTQMVDPETAYIRISAPLLEGYTAEEVIITVNEEIPKDDTYWFITNNLTNCKTSNTTTRIVKGGPYSATITAKDGYSLSTVRMTMGGNHIPVENGVINIETVTGDIVITAVAEVPKGNLADPTSADWQEGYRLSLSAGTAVELAGHTTTNYIPCKVGDVLRVKGLAITGYGSDTISSQNAAKIGTFTEDKTKIGGLYGLTNANNCYGLMVSTNGDISEYTILLRNDGTQTTMTNLKHIRIDGFLMDGYTADDVIITINEEIENEDTVKYSVINYLTNCTNSNSATTVNEGSAYSATITANAGYTIKSAYATMGGSVVTVNNGVINIASVTGDIVITAEAVVKQAADPVTKDIALTSGICIGSDGTDRTQAGYCATPHIDLTNIPKPCTIHLTKAYWCADVSSFTMVRVHTAKTDGTTLINNVTMESVGGSYFTIVDNSGGIGNDVTVTIVSDDVASIRFSGYWCKDGVSDSDVTLEAAGTKVTLTYTPVDDDSGSGDTGSSPSYINLLPSAVDTDGTPYGDGKGYISGYKLSCSSEGGTPSATSGAYVSGFIPINNNADTLRIKNITLHANTNVNNIIFYNKDKTKIHAIQGVAGGFAKLINVDEGNVYRCKPAMWITNDQAANIGFFRFSCGGITDETIVTVNEEIV